jgi:hypothetical protein
VPLEFGEQRGVSPPVPRELLAWTGGLTPRRSPAECQPAAPYSACTPSRTFSKIHFFSQRSTEGLHIVSP